MKQLRMYDFAKWISVTLIHIEYHNDATLCQSDSIESRFLSKKSYDIITSCCFGLKTPRRISLCRGRKINHWKEDSKNTARIEQFRPPTCFYLFYHHGGNEAPRVSRTRFIGFSGWRLSDSHPFDSSFDVSPFRDLAWINTWNLVGDGSRYPRQTTVNCICCPRERCTEGNSRNTQERRYGCTTVEYRSSNLKRGFNQLVVFGQPWMNVCYWRLIGKFKRREAKYR